MMKTAQNKTQLIPSPSTPPEVREPLHAPARETCIHTYPVREIDILRNLARNLTHLIEGCGEQISRGYAPIGCYHPNEILNLARQLQESLEYDLSAGLVENVPDVMALDSRAIETALEAARVSEKQAKAALKAAKRATAILEAADAREPFEGGQ